MHLDELEAGLHRAQGGAPPLLAQRGELLDIERVRHQPALLHRDRARRHRPPRQIAAGVVGIVERGIAIPRTLHAGLTAGMRELDRGHCAVVLQESGDALERSDLLVVPDADIAMSDAALGGHRRGLDHHEPGAALGKLTQMNKMPVIGEAIGCRILAHR